MKKRILSIIILVFLISGCDTTDPKPPEEKPPGYQEDIPWPSLADSPWPMFRGHPMGTGRLNGTIPQFSEITKTYTKFIPASGAVVGEDGPFYFISYGEYSGLVCLDNNGEEKWFFELEKSFYTSKLSTPIILNNGDIIFGYSRSDSIFSISTEGKLNWKISLNTQYELTIGKDGTIYSYSTDPSSINAISRDGELLWKITNNNISTFGNMVISPDGNTLYTTGVFGTALLAYDILTQNLKWQLEGKVDLASPLIDSQGNIYIVLTQGDDAELGIYSLSPEGKERWKMLPNEGTTSAMSPVIDRNGNIYVGFKDLYCISYKGSILWKKDFYIISNYLLIDGIDNILFTLTNPSQAALESMIQINKNGDIVNQINISIPSIAQYYSPAISNILTLLPVPYTRAVLVIK